MQWRRRIAYGESVALRHLHAKYGPTPQYTPIDTDQTYIDWANHDRQLRAATTRYTA